MGSNRAETIEGEVWYPSYIMPSRFMVSNKGRVKKYKGERIKLGGFFSPVVSSSGTLFFRLRYKNSPKYANISASELFASSIIGLNLRKLPPIKEMGDDFDFDEYIKKEVNMNNVKVLIDNGHGKETPGKRSVDGRLMEWQYNRDIANRIVETLRKLNIDAELLVPEEEDIPLSERVRRANDIYRKTGRNAILISIHCNAAGDGTRWTEANGWSAYISPSASVKSTQLATCIAKSVNARDLKVRKELETLWYWRASLAMCRDTNCPAVLTENFFMDNKEDVEFMLWEEGKKKIVESHVDGILSFLSYE